MKVVFGEVVKTTKLVLVMPLRLDPRISTFHLAIAYSRQNLLMSHRLKASAIPRKLLEHHHPCGPNTLDLKRTHQANPAVQAAGTLTEPGACGCVNQANCSAAVAADRAQPGQQCGGSCKRGGHNGADFPGGGGPVSAIKRVL